MNKEQLELGFNAAQNLPLPARPPRRLTRARWWFEQMHSVVDRAFDWSAAPAPRPEQIYLTLARGR
jgi:hypothetical protein